MNTPGPVYRGRLDAKTVLTVLAQVLAEQMNPDEQLLKEAQNALRHGLVNEQYLHVAQQIISDITDALQKYAPPYCYFGTHPINKELLGWWPSWRDILRLPDYMAGEDIDWRLISPKTGETVIYRGTRPILIGIPRS